MRTNSTERLWDRLAAKGLVIGENPPRADQHSPWFVRVMLGFAGWLGAFFLLGFVGVSLQFIIESNTASLFTGAAACAAAAFIFNISRGKDFAVQFGLAVSLAGQALFIWGLWKIFRESAGVRYLAIAVFEALLVAFIINTIHRVASTLAAAVSFSFALSLFHTPHLAPALITAGFAVVWLNEQGWSARGSLARPVGYGLVLAAMCINGTLLIGDWPLWLGHRVNNNSGFVMFSYWAGILLNSAVFLFVVSRLFGREGIRFDSRLAQVALVAALAITLSSFKAPGIIAGLVIVLLGYANGNRVLTGLGIFALIAYLSHYYYQLETTLLIKSAVLVATGMVLLVARFVLSRVLPDKAEEGGNHA